MADDGDEGKLPSVDHIPSCNEGAMVKSYGNTTVNGAVNITHYVLFSPAT